MTNSFVPNPHAEPEEIEPAPPLTRREIRIAIFQGIWLYSLSTVPIAILLYFLMR
jgi:hypothetical protein